jgi:hypothetical protein
MNLPGLAYGAEETTAAELGGRCPCLDGLLHPVRHRDRPHVTTLTDEICEDPMFLSNLKVLDLEGYKLRSTQAATEKHS